MVFETKLPPNAQSSKETDIRRRRCSNLVAADMICDHRHCFNLQIGCVGCFSHTCDLEAEALGLEMERDVFLVELSYRLGAVLCFGQNDASSQQKRALSPSSHLRGSRAT
jgi:hypothetical protein